MKKGILAAALFCAAFAVRAQQAPPELDKSPLDMSYFPADYPILKIQKKLSGPLFARVLYGRPHKNDRAIFGELVPYGSVWRLGANEATEIEFFKDAKVAGKKVPKGRYTMYAIPATGKWTIILNRETDTWGAFAYDMKKDVLRVDVATEKTDAPVEVFSLFFDKNTDKSASLVIEWDDTRVKLPVAW